MEKETRNYRNSQIEHCLLKGVLTDSLNYLEKPLLTHLPDEKILNVMNMVNAKEPFCQRTY